MILSIIVFALTGLTSFTILFCCDKAELWNGYDDTPNLRMPSITDVGNISDFRKNDYITKVIAPAYHYFEENKEIENYQSKDSGSEIACWLILIPSLVLLQWQCLLRIGFTDSKIICILISIVTCALSIIIARLIYKHTSLALGKFTYTIDDLKKDHERNYQYDECDLSKEDSLNNYIIDVHGNYLNRIKETVIFRSNIRKVLCAFATIIYFLFFMKSPD